VVRALPRERRRGHGGGPAGHRAGAAGRGRTRGARLGGRRVDLLDLGPGHTDHDLVVGVPDAGAVFAGDLVEQGAPPSFGPDSVAPAWPRTLDALLGLRPATVVPGHGDPVEAAFVAAQRDLLGRVAALWGSVARGEIDAAYAERVAPVGAVPWPRG
jgi:glyoxylase-like metal-dependent hydrolase (beta-lactamase superfamily II)